MYDFIDAEPSQLKIRHLGRQVKIRGSSSGNKFSECCWPLYAQRFRPPAFFGEGWMSSRLPNKHSNAAAAAVVSTPPPA